VDALKEKILYFYEHQDVAREFGQKAREKITERYTWDDYGERIKNAYQMVLENRSNRSA
jgi:glycosyltransferase involved in cell wall biosynthesis